MGIQETVVELFQEQRIDKAVAYRLLADCKNAAQGTEAASSSKLPTAQQDRHRCIFPAASLHTDLQIITSWCYLLHIVTGLEELEFDYVQGQHATPIRIRLAVHHQQTAEQLQLAIEAAINRHEIVTSEPSPYAWFETESASNHPEIGFLQRSVSAIRIHPESDDIAIDLCAQKGAQGATLSADWPDTLRHFYQSMRSSSKQALAELDWLPARHRRLLRQYNYTNTCLPEAQTIPELIHTSLLDDKQMAIRTTAADINYHQYRARAYRIANLLRYRGVQRNERVAVMMHRTIEMPPALFGIICAGAAYVPIEPDMPAERVQTIIRDTGARFLVTDADTLHANPLNFEQSGIRRIVCVDSWGRRRHGSLVVDGLEVLETCDTLRPQPINQAQDICYVIYTSGSTGQPKGVAVSHGAIVNSLVGVNNVFGIHAKDRIVCFSSYGFDLSVWDMFGCALAGACLVLPSKTETRDPEQLLRLLHASGATVWDSAPTGMSQLLLPLAGKEFEAVESMRLVMLGGEFIQRSLPAEIKRVFPHSKLANLGGNTEAAVYSIRHYPVDTYESHWKSIPYGIPLANQRFYVLNEALKHCAIGEKGVMYIAGNSVGIGYLGDQEKTDKAFLDVCNPDGVSERMYRTGDLGILHAEGYMEICGRADRQIKLRGFRIELGEIESQMLALPEIDQAAVVAQRDHTNQLRLIGFYVTRVGEISASILRGKLGEKLPEYMIPTQFVYLSNPPISASGKLDRKALEKHDVERHEIGQEYVKPQSEVEQELAQELARMLRLDRVGVDDDFFLIGGDSLISLQYLSVLSRLGYSASPADIQQGRSIRGVLARVKAHGSDQQSDQQGLIPFSPMSRKFFDRLPLQNRDHWHQLMMIRFDHKPDIARLQRAISAVNQHHPLLRSRYTKEGLQVQTNDNIRFKFVDLGSVSFLRRQSALNEQVADLRTTVTLQSETLSNLRLIRMRDNDYRLLWVLHHLIVDANCWRILLDDLATAYRQPKTELLRTASMADYVNMVDAAVPQAIADLRALPPITRMEIPRLTDAGSPPNTGIEADARTLRLIFSPAQTQALFDAIQAHSNMTLNLALLTSLSLALRDWRSNADVRFDVISNGRSADPTHDYSRTVAWFATHNPFMVEAHGDALQVLDTVRTAWTQYQDKSRFFVEVCNRVKGQTDHPLGAHIDQPLLFSFLGDFDSLKLPEGWQVMGSIGQNRARENKRTHEIDFEALVASGHLMIRLVYPKQVMRGSHAKQLLQHFKKALTQLVAQLHAQQHEPLVASVPSKETLSSHSSLHP